MTSAYSLLPDGSGHSPAVFVKDSEEDAPAAVRSPRAFLKTFRYFRKNTSAFKPKRRSVFFSTQKFKKKAVRNVPDGLLSVYLHLSSQIPRDFLIASTFTMASAFAPA